MTYQVVAVRSNASGTAARFTVNPGRAPGGEAMATVAGPKLAA